MDAADPLEELLRRVALGDEAAQAELYRLVYDELRSRARALMAGGLQGTLQATAVVHEAFLKLSRPGARWETRKHFVAVATRAMRQVLADQVKARHRLKRSNQGERVTLASALEDGGEATVDLVAFHEALERLSRVNESYVRVVELRLLGGLTVEETADALGVSTPTVKREWRAARAWLRRELDEP